MCSRKPCHTRCSHSNHNHNVFEEALSHQVFALRSQVVNAQCVRRSLVAPGVRTLITSCQCTMCSKKPCRTWCSHSKHKFSLHNVSEEALSHQMFTVQPQVVSAQCVEGSFVAPGVHTPTASCQCTMCPRKPCRTRCSHSNRKLSVHNVFEEALSHQVFSPTTSCQCTMCSRKPCRTRCSHSDRSKKC